MEVTNTTAKILLPANTTFDQYEIEYSPRANDWYEVYSTTINNLSPGYPYRFRFRATCGVGYTAYHYIDFTTDCLDPNNVSLATIGVNQVTLQAPDLRQYEVEYSLAGKNAWITLPDYYNTIYSLKAGTHYELRIRGRCTVPGPYRTLQFTTLCPSLTALAVTDITFNSATITGLSNYASEATVEYSADNLRWTPVGGNLFLYPLVPGTRYSVRAKLNCTDMASDFITKEFTTPCPEVFSLSANAITPFGAGISWYDPSNADHYTVRYTLSTGATTTTETREPYIYLEGFAPGTRVTVDVAPPCIATPTYTTITFNTLCYTPDRITANAVTHTSAELSWTADFSTVPYIVDYAIVGTNAWQTIHTEEAHITLPDLRPGGNYEVRVRIHCLDQSANYAHTSIQTPLYEKTVYFPNPTDGNVTVHPAKNLIGNHFILCDNLGRIIASGALPDYTIDLSTFSPGMYLLKIEGEEPMKINKL